jgi:hypothetical protein
VREGVAVNMKTLRPTGKLKSRKTIRKMTPMARKLAHLTRSAQSEVTRLKYLTDELQRLEMVAAATDKALNARIVECEHMRACAEYWETQHERLMKLPGVSIQYEIDQERHPWPELPNGEGVSGEPSAGIGGLSAGYHSGSDADPRD